MWCDAGGFGKVYAGHWRRQPVAIKVVAQHAPLDGSLLAEFHREVRAQLLSRGVT